MKFLPFSKGISFACLILAVSFCLPSLGFFKPLSCSTALLPEVTVVVDPVSSASLLVEELKLRGMPCIYVRTGTYNPAVAQPRDWEGDFLGGVEYRGPDDWEALLQYLSSFRVAAVVPGLDRATPLADRLASHLEVANNGTDLSEARVDKKDMGEVAQAAGLRTIPQFKSSSLEKIIAWIAERSRLASARGTTKRFVLKPPRSAGTDGIFTRNSDDLEGIAEAFAAILGKPNFFGQLNEEVLVQEFIEGDEYIVDTVSWNGEFRVVMIWKYHLLHRDDGSIIFDRVELMPSIGEVQEKLIEYVGKALAALQIRHGAAHFELYVPAKEEQINPVLLEVGARMGGGLPEITKEATGVNIVEVFADTITDPDKFLREADERYQLKKHALIVGINSPDEGSRFSYAGLTKLRTLNSFIKFAPVFEDGARLPKTTGLASTPARIWLVNSSRESLQEDYLRIRAWEETEKNFLVIPPGRPTVPHTQPSPWPEQGAPADSLLMPISEEPR